MIAFRLWIIINVMLSLDVAEKMEKSVHFVIQPIMCAMRVMPLSEKLIRISCLLSVCCHSVAVFFRPRAKYVLGGYKVCRHTLNTYGTQTEVKETMFCIVTVL